MKYTQTKTYSKRFIKYLKKSTINKNGIGIYEIEFSDITHEAVKAQVEKDYVLLISELKGIKNYQEISTAAVEGFIIEYLTYCHFKSYFDKKIVDKQHWIPFCYLKGFAHEPQKDIFRLSRINSINSKIDLTSLNIDFRTKKNSQDIIYSYQYENFFSVIEDDYGKIRDYWIKYLIEGNTKVPNGLTKSSPISAYEKIVLTIFGASLFMRTKDRISQVKDRFPGIEINSTQIFYQLLLKMSINFSRKKLIYYFSPISLFTSQNPVSAISEDINTTDWYMPVHTNMSIFFTENESVIGSNELLNKSIIMQQRMILDSKNSPLSFLYGNASKPVFSMYKEYFKNFITAEIDYPISTWKKNYPDI